MRGTDGNRSNIGFRKNKTVQYNQCGSHDSSDTAGTDPGQNRAGAGGHLVGADDDQYGKRGAAAPGVSAGLQTTERSVLQEHKIYIK